MMTPTRIEDKFYPLTPDVAQTLRKAQLTAAEWRLWSFLAQLDPFGDRYQMLPDMNTILEQANIQKTTFYKAIRSRICRRQRAKFESLKLFDFQATGTAVVNFLGRWEKVQELDRLWSSSHGVLQKLLGE